MEHNETTAALAAYIKSELSARGETQRGLASKIGVAHVTLARRLTGKSPFLITELELIAQHFDISLVDMLTVGTRSHRLSA